MLKSCWECVIGNGVFRDNEGPYGARLNGNTQTAATPPWPKPQYDNEIMFLLPRILHIGDRVDVTGILRPNPQSLIINLVTDSSNNPINNIDYNNIACQISADFLSNKLGLQSIFQGQRREGEMPQEPVVSDLFSEDSNKFQTTFAIDSSSSQDNLVKIYTNGSLLGLVTLEHNLDNIRYLTLSGDVEKVENINFQFA